ncbi:PEP-CTERM sorting domain-containing protein [Rubrivivax gelatinosus]|uniref:PEP-CTERM sorting domain-containing protein n=1 Tax=Rubrivivax gelatinosus TaxID=28068 RepID=A0ABS1DUD4_RUBGE|nr:esterase-like activity of phytase family protein [Rubrivivax gelatinosus]MBK1613298.1 PEP-CTERM sorting domain-containing protein [Rubrivivax gelatinosus]MBK1713336.1 PEP-CTERM sorting domain-containing protein [Rubrivivax gelatinosus]
MHKSLIAAAVTALAAALAPAAQAQTLTGWALLPAATFADGPTSGQFASPNPYGTNLPPFAGQPVQGFSAVLPGPVPGSFRVMPDNGFGAQNNSADALLRIYTVLPEWRTRFGGRGIVHPADWSTGRVRRSFDTATHIGLSDPDHHIGWTIQADLTHYYGVETNPAVDASIRTNRLLTGADFDIESVRRTADGHYWFGDEFGPFLLETDASGRLLGAPIPLPGVRSPQNPEVLAGSASANLGSSGGFEGMALSRDGKKLYALLEKTVAGDADKTLRINEFDLATRAYTGVRYVYPLAPDGTAIGDMTAVDEHRFIVIERNGSTATSGTPFKKLYLIDIEGVQAGGTVKKTELVDLMAIADPDDLNSDGSSTFSLPYTTIEDVLPLDARTLLVINDNNFPYGGGRALASDDTEFIRIRLPEGLKVCVRCDGTR